MQDGFIKVASITPRVRVADVAFNVESWHQKKPQVLRCQVVVLPELLHAGYTCEDLLMQQDALLDALPSAVWFRTARTASSTRCCC